MVSGTQNMPFVPQMVYAIHQHYQTQLLNLSPSSKQYLCEQSSHFPQITEPEKVSTAILETIAS